MPGWRTHRPHAHLAAIALLTPALGCREASSASEAVADQPLTAVRDIRVLLGRSDRTLRIAVGGAYVLRNRSGAVLSRGEDLPWSEVSGGRSIVLGNQALGDTWIEIASEGDGLVAASRRERDGWSDPRYYTGYLRLLLAGDRGDVQVVNIVDLESYVAGVLPGELYANFHEESFRTQAIAARTYAMYQMSTSSGSTYDVSDTEASQVYEGVSDTHAYRQASAAVDYTRGLVCTWDSPDGPRVFCTFFSSACGGRSQDVANCKATPSIPPLAGGVQCDYCRIAKGEAYRWPTRTLTKSEVLARLLARYPQAAELGALQDVRVLEQDPGGRPVTIGLVGENGKPFELKAENFRLAMGGG